MAGADQRPGRRRAVPEPKPRRRGRGAESSEATDTTETPAPYAPRRRLEGPAAPPPAPAEATAETPRIRIASGKSVQGSRRAGKPGREPEPSGRRARRGDDALTSTGTLTAIPAAPAPAASVPDETTSIPAFPLTETTTTALPAVSDLTSDPKPSPADLVPPRLPEPKGTGNRWSTGLLASLWVLLTLAGVAGVVSAWVTLPVTLPALVPEAGAVVVTTTYAFALGVRAGGRPVISALLAAALGGAAVATATPVLLAAATVSTTVLGAVLGLLATTPARGFPAVVRECVVAVLVAVVAAFAASAYGAQISVARAGYLGLGLSLLAALALVYRLGAGLQGLGTRGAIMLFGGVGLLAVTLAYASALARWGPPGLVSGIDDVTTMLRARIGAIPRPTEFMVGIPVLAWGVFSRARRRQGWWGSGFGAAGLAAITTSLLNPDLSLVEFGLGLGYNLVLGLLLGLLLIRADTFLSGTRGRRARQAEEALAHRPEPGRLHPLL